jgi:hypothetical protein
MSGMKSNRDRFVDKWLGYDDGPIGSNPAHRKLYREIFYAMNARPDMLVHLGLPKIVLRQPQTASERRCCEVMQILFKRTMRPDYPPTNPQSEWGTF